MSKSVIAAKQAGIRFNAMQIIAAYISPTDDDAHQLMDKARIFGQKNNAKMHESPTAAQIRTILTKAGIVKEKVDKMSEMDLYTFLAQNYSDYEKYVDAVMTKKRSSSSKTAKRSSRSSESKPAKPAKRVKSAKSSNASSVKKASSTAKATKGRKRRANPCLLYTSPSPRDY